MTPTMARRIFALASPLVLLALLTQASFVSASPRQSVSGWKLPLPTGSYQITQGDQDSCTSTHCRSSRLGQWVYCSLDLWSANIDGLPVLAPAVGSVLFVGEQRSGAGKYLTIQHNDGLVSQYQHLQTIYVKSGDRVAQGQPIGRVDSTGKSTGAHLHFGVFKDSSYAECLKITSLDGNTDFRTNAIVTSSNSQVGSIPGDAPSPITPAPPVLTRPAPPALSSPGNGDRLAQTTDVTLRWNVPFGATAYYLEYSGGPYGTLNSGWQSAVVYRIGTMWPGTYQWKVKARNAAGEGDWSSTFTFVIEGPTDTPTPTPTDTPTPAPNAPAASTLRDPASGATLPQSTDVWFAWNRDAGASEYYLEYWGGPYGTLNSGWINDTAYHVGQMWPGTYQWHVKARNASGVESNWSETRAFTIIGPATTQPPATTVTPTLTPTPSFTPSPPPSGPSVPSLSSPGNGASLPQTTNVTLAWNAASNATQYQVELWGGPYSLMTPCDWQSGTSCRIGQMWPGVMAWHVKARNASGQESNWSDTWTFTVLAPDTPTFTPSPTATTPPPSFAGNVAPQSQRSPDGIGSSNAFDGNLSTFWTDGLGHRFTLTLSLPGTKTVYRILVWDRPQNSPDNNQINALLVTLSNGMSKTFGMDSMGNRCIDITLSPPQSISSVTLKADDASGNNGLGEVEIWDGPKTGGLGCGNSGVMP